MFATPAPLRYAVGVSNCRRWPGPTRPRRHTARNKLSRLRSYEWN